MPSIFRTNYEPVILKHMSSDFKFEPVKHKQTTNKPAGRSHISDLLTRYEEISKCSCSCSTYNQTLSENQEERVETGIDNNNGKT